MSTIEDVLREEKKELYKVCERLMAEKIALKQALATARHDASIWELAADAWRKRYQTLERDVYQGKVP